MSTLPEQMQDLPVDERRKLPIPVMNTFDDRHDFTAINGQWIHEHPRDCGICGKPLGYWMAFVGGPASTTNRMFLDPAMHVVIPTPTTTEFDLSYRTVTVT